VQHLLVFRLGLLQAVLPFLDPAHRHTHRLRILGLRPLRVQSHQASQIGSHGVVYCFHDGTSWLIDFSLVRSVPFFLLSPPATMFLLSSGHEVGNSYTERSEGSRPHVWVITRVKGLDNPPFPCYDSAN